MFPFLASFPSAANWFLLKRSAYGKISGPPKSPRGSDAQIPLDYFWKPLSVCHWVSREKCPLVPAQSWGDVQTLLLLQMNCCLCSRERKIHGPWTSTRGHTNPIPCPGDELFPQDKWKHWWAQQWWNLSLDPECPAVLAPRPRDYVFQCVFIFPAVRFNWMSVGIAQLSWNWKFHMFCSKNWSVGGVQSSSSGLCQDIRCWELHLDGTFWDLTAKGPCPAKLNPSGCVPEPRLSSASGRIQFVKLHQALWELQTVSACRSLWFPVQPTGPSAWDGETQLPWFPCSFYHSPPEFIGFPK